MAKNASNLLSLNDFWFSDGLDVWRPAWFTRDDAFDEELRLRFGGWMDAAGRGEFDHLISDPLGALALTILLDQLPRNLFRGQATAFAFDAKARQVADAAIIARADLSLPATARVFLYLPFEHSEALEDQDRSVALFEGLRGHPPHDEPGGTIDYARRHHAVIARFGRFPHRNNILGRQSTAEEQVYLSQPGAGF